MNILIVYGALVELGWGRSVSLLEAIKENGHDVDYLEFPVFKLSNYFSKNYSKNFGLPVTKLPFLGWLHNLLQKYQINKIIGNTKYDLIYFYSPLPPVLFDYLKRLYPSATFAYDIPDDRVEYHRKMNGEKAARLIQKYEYYLLKMCDLVVVINEFHRVRVVSKTKSKILIVPNGINLSIYNNQLKPKTKQCIYVGGINFRLDMERLSKVMSLNNLQIDLYGPIDVSYSVKFSSKMRYCGSVHSKKIPDLLCQYQYGFLPYNDSGFNRGSQPLKVLQYLAAGLSVVDFSGIGKQYDVKGIYQLDDTDIIPRSIEKPDLKEIQTYKWENLVKLILKEVEASG